MWDRLRTYWLPRFLFVMTLALAVILGVLALVSRWLFAEKSPAQLLTLFAHDVTVQRTAIACAIGLVVTAFVFFRPATQPKPKTPSPKEPPPGNMAGA